MKLLVLVLQIMALWAIGAAGNMIAGFFHLDVPGSIIGIAMLLIMMHRQWIPVEKIEFGAEFLIAELLLFFVPSAIGVVRFKDILANDLGQLLLTIGSSIFLLLLFVGALTEIVMRIHGRRNA